MSTHNICFCAEIKTLSILFGWHSLFGDPQYRFTILCLADNYVKNWQNLSISNPKTKSQEYQSTYQVLWKSIGIYWSYLLKTIILMDEWTVDGWQKHGQPMWNHNYAPLSCGGVYQETIIKLHHISTYLNKSSASGGIICLWQVIRWSTYTDSCTIQCSRCKL